MKRRTSFIIGITTAIVTVIGLNAAFGSRYRMHQGFYNQHACMQKQHGENKTTLVAAPKDDSINRR